MVIGSYIQIITLNVNGLNAPTKRVWLGRYRMYIRYMCVHAKSLQSCSTLCNPTDCSPPGSSVHEIFQARILEWIAMLSPGDHPNSGIEPTSLMSLTLAGRFFTTSTTWEVPVVICACMQFHLPHHLLDPQIVLHTLFYTVRLIVMIFYFLSTDCEN